MGFPIRRSSDQSSFAAPQGLSQRTTSFIASQRQGIHRMLFRHLIALMIHARRKALGNTRTPQRLIRKTVSWIAPGTCLPNTTGPHTALERPKLVSGPEAPTGHVPSSRCQTPAGAQRAARESTNLSGRASAGKASPAGRASQLVEPDGIEPTTSSLQSSRSPN